MKGQLAKFDANHNFLVEYASGFYTGNDSDAVALAYYNTPGTGRNAIGRAQDRTETAFWYSTAKAAAEIYERLGDSAKAAEMHELANRIRDAVLTLWDPVDRVFKMRDVETGNLVPWKDQQNFSPFTEGVAPPEYRDALRFYADAAQFSIMPFYTANRADKAAAAAAGKPGSNNFSNINATLQARLFAKALKDYPSEYVTPDMYRKLLEWLSWVQYVNGDNRYPDNNEYFSNWNPTTQTFSRSSIHHNILGAFNFMIIDDIVGITPRLDDRIELRPIDVGWDHYLIDNLRYHGQDVSIVWDKPGDGKHYYPGPEGMSIYVNGRRVHTSDDIEHVVTEPVVSRADQVRLTGRTADMFQKAGVALDNLPNLAQGKPATASFTAPETSTAFATDGFTISGPTVPVGSYVMNPAYGAVNTIWGTKGSPNAEDWLEIDLGKPTRFDSVKTYFYSNKEWSNSPPQGPVAEGNTYREPASYRIEADGRTVASGVGAPNFNHLTFEGVTAQRVRLVMTPQPGYGIGVKEIQVFDTKSRTDAPGGVGATVPATLSLTVGDASFGAFTPGVARTYTATTTANVISTAGEAALTASGGRLANGAFELRTPLRIAIDPGTWDGPVSNAPVTVAFEQDIEANEPLRTGAYSRTVTFTLATTTP